MGCAGLRGVPRDQGHPGLQRLTQLSVGIDVAEEAKGLDLVALDSRRQVTVSRGRLTVAEAVALILEELRPTVVCIDSPSGWARTGRSRASERALARLGYQCFYTGQDPGDHPFYRWMRVGFRVFEAVASEYPLYRGDVVAGRAAEVFPNATARVLLGRRPAPGESKVSFRRTALAEAGVDGELPTIDRVDAALGALTGLCGLRGHAIGLGAAEEGSVLLPTGP